MTKPNNLRLFDVVAMVFVTTLLVSNTIAVKITMIANLPIAAGIICFPIAYIFGDVLTEVYGYARTRRVIWTGFLCLALMSLLYYIAVALPPAAFWEVQQIAGTEETFEAQKAFAQIFGHAPRIAFASFLAYLVGSFLNAVVMSRLKVAMRGKHLWIRTIGSTIVGEGADSLVFNLTAFLFVFTFGEVLFIALSGFILKTAYEVIATPITYAVVGWLKRIEGVDQYDEGVSYNPFKVT